MSYFPFQSQYVPGGIVSGARTLYSATQKLPSAQGIFSEARSYVAGSGNYVSGLAQSVRSVARGYSENLSDKVTAFQSAHPRLGEASMVSSEYSATTSLLLGSIGALGTSIINPELANANLTTSYLTWDAAGGKTELNKILERLGSERERLSPVLEKIRAKIGSGYESLDIPIMRGNGSSL